MIEFKNVKLNIKNIDILNDINFKIEENTVTCFLGAKNTGKSSILKIIAGVNKKYSGEVYIDGVLLEDSKKKIGMVFSENEEDTSLNVYEYLKFYGLLNGVDDKEIDIYIDNMLKKFLLMSYKYTSLEMLDNESTKLIHIIRVMLGNPDILLFDNIFIEENYEYNEKIVNFIKQLVGKKTIIIASRNLKNLENLCDNIGVLEDGKLIIFGEKNEVYRKAELNRKIEVEIADGVEDAVNVLKLEENVYNVIYEDNKIVFSLNGDKERESEILKKLTDNNIKVYSYKKETVTADQLFGKLKEM